MGILITVIIAILAFIGGTLWNKFRYEQYIKKNGCPFKHACMTYDAFETKEAVKRILNLLVENDVSKKEIKDIIKQSL